MIKPSKKPIFLMLVYIALVSVFTVGCGQIKKDHLSLWNNQAPAKEALVNYINEITDSKSPNFIPVEDRIAVFDMDGTLLLETDPIYFDWLLFEHRVLDDPNYKPSQKQLEIARTVREKNILPELSAEFENMVAEVYKGFTIEEFYAYVRNFMQEDQPGFVGMKRGEAFYKPMLEVVEYLVKNKFMVYICSGTDRLIVRPLMEKNLPYIAPHQIIGSDSTLVARNQADADDSSYTFQKGDELVMGGKSIVKNLQMKKVDVIAQEIGKKPVLAFGNSSGDASMLNYTIYNNKYKALSFMLQCDDLEREYGNMEKAEKMHAACEKYGWICVSMRDDWKTIYGDHIKRR